MLEQLLKNYEQHYHFSLRLTMNHQSVYSGFTGKSQTECFFLCNQIEYSLECSEKDASHSLKSIQIAIMPFLSQSIDHCFASVIQGSADCTDIEALRHELGENQYVVVMIAGTKDLVSVKEMMIQLLEQHAMMHIQKDELWLLLKIEQNTDVLDILKSMRSTLETELYTKICMFVSSKGKDVACLKMCIDETRNIQRLIRKYEPGSLMASSMDVWMLKMIDALDECEKESVLDSLGTKDLKELDDELIMSAEVFMKNNLSISATARALYVHRNTLIYRLDKIVQLTGLDIRQFEDAQKLCFAMKFLKK